MKVLVRYCLMALMCSVFLSGTRLSMAVSPSPGHGDPPPPYEEEAQGSTVMITPVITYPDPTRFSGFTQTLCQAINRYPQTAAGVFVGLIFMVTGVSTVAYFLTRPAGSGKAKANHTLVSASSEPSSVEIESFLQTTTPSPKNTTVSFSQLIPFKRNQTDFWKEKVSKRKLIWLSVDEINAQVHGDKLKPFLFGFTGFRGQKIPDWVWENPDHPAESVKCAAWITPDSGNPFCADNSTTGYCRVQFEQNGQISTMIGQLVESVDQSESGCYVMPSATLGRDTDSKPFYIDKNEENGQLFQVLAEAPGLSYRWSAGSQWSDVKTLPVAASSFLEGSDDRLNTRLCKYCPYQCGSRLGYPMGISVNPDDLSAIVTCQSLSSFDTGVSGNYFLSPERTDESAEKAQSPATQVFWRRNSRAGKLLAGKKHSEKVRHQYCVPKRAFGAFYLGAQIRDEESGNVYCAYITVDGHHAYYALNYDYISFSTQLATEFQVPRIRGRRTWTNVSEQGGISSFPENSLVVGYSLPDSSTLTSVPVYFCSFIDSEGIKRFGQVFGATRNDRQRDNCGSNQGKTMCRSLDKLVEASGKNHDTCKAIKLSAGKTQKYGDFLMPALEVIESGKNFKLLTSE